MESDLGISGDDAIDFLEKYNDKYKVDVSKFDFQKYFRSEGEVSSSILPSLFGMKQPGKQEITETICSKPLNWASLTK